MSISNSRRKVEKVAYNFSDAQVKIRKATSNDPWGPSTALMSEIADLTHNPVAQQCRENVFTIETLKDFQHVEDSRDQGLNIREKAKQITSLLSDDERLKNERTRFILTRNKFKQNNPGPVGAESRRSNRHHISDFALGKKHLGPIGKLLILTFSDPEYEEARPSTATEEEMQLQIALAPSREECEKVDERKSDDARLQMTLEESQKEADRLATTKQGTVSSGQLTQSALDDLLSLGVGELVSSNSDQPSSSGAWNSMGMADPWGVPQSSTPTSAHTNDGLFTSSNNDPWATSAAPQPAASNSDPVAAWETPAASAPAATLTSSNSFDFLGGDLLLPTNSMSASTSNFTNGTRKTPENLLGENKNLVNLDNLLGSNAPSTAGGKPFFTSSAPAANPFAAQQRKSPTLNEMRAAQGQALDGASWSFFSIQPIC
ncbi:hypothetical protein CAEBREN_08070 [Caenorhabditis brenneri]|uniref:ENTH domain-containing protein n=1 Tax=Caenorhabditis brenneri TaxID=135651 RepID=G0NNT5_CAEBE|nr:hypothetical protein CAEBREN_08070 [Caenorhabditis brenneri]